MWSYGAGRGLGRRRFMGPSPQWIGQMPELPPPQSGSLRVVVSTDNDKGLEAPVSFRFARAPYLTVVDIDNGKVVNVQSISNSLASGMRGVGVGVGQWIISIGAKAVVAPHLGPNIQMVLKQANIITYIVPYGIKVIDALKRVGLVS